MNDSASTEREEPLLDLLPEASRNQIRRLQIRSRRAIDTDFLGTYRSAVQGKGLNFTELREYEPGEDVRHIHWKATARAGKPYLKRFEEERQMRLLIAVDASESMLAFPGHPRLKRAQEFAALLAYLAWQATDQFGILFFSEKIQSFLPPGGGRQQLQRVLASLSGLESRCSQETSLDSLFEFLSNKVKRKTSCFVISDFLAEITSPLLNAASKRHELAFCSVQSEEDASLLPGKGLFRFHVAESKSPALLDLSSDTVRGTFRDLLRKNIENCSHRARSAGAQFAAYEGDCGQALRKLMQQKIQMRR